MKQTANFNLGPENTPRTITNLIRFTCGTTLAATIITMLLNQIFKMNGPEDWLSLSWVGLINWHLWQPFTYFFIYNTIGYGFTFSYIINLLFQMYILWVVGSQVYERIGKRSFLGLYLLTGIGIGLLTILLGHFFGRDGILSGPTIPITAIFMVWTLMYPESELLLFFLIPIKAKWLMAGVLGALMLVSLSTLHFVTFLSYFLSAMAGYLYALIAMGLRMPFPGFAGFENWILKIAGRKDTDSVNKGPKVFDISTGRPKLDDDSFIDAMLEKISKRGENSLTWEERKRMEQISEKKRRDRQKGS